MRFNLRTMLYAVAVLAAGMGAFGGAGVPIAAVVLWFWAVSIRARDLALRSLLWLAIPVGIWILLFPPLDSRGPSRATECKNNLYQIALALQLYEADYGTFPPPYIGGKDGKPMHSWRILIQPYMERQDIYDAYKFDELWNSPNNAKLANVDQPLFRCPSTSQSIGETTVFAVVGSTAAWVAGRGRKLDEFTDGADQTLLLIEAVGQGVNWLEPKDLSYEEAINLLTAKNVKQTAVVHARQEAFHYKEFSRNIVTADGSAARLPIGCSEELAKGLLTIDGDERLSSWTSQRWTTESRLNWSRISCVVIFALLAILPRFVLKQPDDRTASLAESPDAL